jgi:8-oxo-dGTP pyrophosphatase MutT (NUDIX family)
MRKNKGAGILFICDSKVLLLQNKKGMWEIPGGKREKGEKPLDGARRETHEECGICPRFAMIGCYTFENLKNKYKIFFAKVKNKFNCEISNEHLKYNWFDIKKLPQPLHNKVAGALEFLKKNELALNDVNAI